MKVTINLEKKYAYVIIGLLILATGILVVNALVPGVAPNPGHLISEVAPPNSCANGQILQFIDETTGWGCVEIVTDTNCYVSGYGDCVWSSTLYGYCPEKTFIVRTDQQLGNKCCEVVITCD